MVRFSFYDKNSLFHVWAESGHCPSKYGCLIRAVRGTRNFIWQRATLVQGCTSEAQLNMDVNLCRLPDERKSMPKFPVPLADIMWHPPLMDSAPILSKQVKRQFIIKKSKPLRTVGISHQRKSDSLGMPQNFFAGILSVPLRNRLTICMRITHDFSCSVSQETKKNKPGRGWKKSLNLLY